MKDLYTFSKHSWHVQFFKWMWNINPVYKYKTMCPYFWQFIGSIIILPLIVLWKIVDYVAKPIDRWMDDISERAAEKEMQNILFRFHSAELVKDKYTLWKSKCWNKYVDGLVNMGTISDEEYREFRRQAFIYELELEAKKNYAKAKTQRNIDEIRYGIIGKILLWSLFAITCFFIGVFVNWFVHLFTFAEFIRTILLISVVFIGAFILFAIAGFILWINDKYNCDGELTKFNPFIYIIGLFKGIGKLFMIIIDMIKNLYKDACPIITWKE